MVEKSNKGRRLGMTVTQDIYDKLVFLQAPNPVLGKPRETQVAIISRLISKEYDEMMNKLKKS